MLVLAVILGILAGIGFAYYIVAKQVYNSNNYGDSMGEINDFSQGTWDIVERRDYKTKKKNWVNDRILIENQSRILRGNQL